MVSLTNTTAQTLASGQNLTFNTTRFHTGRGECHRQGTGNVKLRADGIYRVSFSANISGAAGTEVQLSIAIGGEVLPSTTMKSVSATAGDLHNVSISVPVQNCCCDYDRITVTNSGTVDVTVDTYPLLSIKRES